MAGKMNVSTGVGKILYAKRGTLPDAVKVFSERVVSLGLTPLQTNTEIYGSNQLNGVINGAISGDIEIIVNGLDEDVMIDTLNMIQCTTGGYIDNGASKPDLVIMCEESIGVDDDMAYMTLYHVKLNNIESKTTTMTGEGVEVSVQTITGKAYKHPVDGFKYVNSTISTGFAKEAWDKIWGTTVPKGIPGKPVIK